MEIVISLEKYYEWYSKKLEAATRRGDIDDIDELNAIHTAFMHLVKKFEVKNG